MKSTFGVSSVTCDANMSENSELDGLSAKRKEEEVVTQVESKSSGPPITKDTDDSTIRCKLNAKRQGKSLNADVPLPPYDTPNSRRTLLSPSSWFTLSINGFLRSFWTALIFSGVCDLSYISVFLSLSGPYLVVHAAPLVNIAMDVFMVAIHVWERYPCPPRVCGFQRHYILLATQAMKHLVLFALVSMIIVKLVGLISGGISNPLGVLAVQVRQLNLTLAERTGVLCTSIVSVLANLIALMHPWNLPQKGSGSQLLLAVSCFCNFLMGIVEIKLYHDSMLIHGHSANGTLYQSDTSQRHGGAVNVTITTNGDTRTVLPARMPRMLPVLYLYTAAFLVCGSTIGCCLAVVINEANRLSDIISKVAFFMDCYLAVVALLCLVLFGNSLTLKVKSDTGFHVATGIPVIFACGFGLCIMIIMCSNYVRLRLPPSLEVEVLDLKALTSSQKSAYAKMITYNKKSNPGVSGEAILLLMEAYSATELHGMTCKVLRVYSPVPQPQSLSYKKLRFHSGKGTPHSTNHLKERQSSSKTIVNPKLKRDRKRAAADDVGSLGLNSSLYEEKDMYQPSRAWEALDLQKTVFDEESVFDLNTIEAVPKPLSKNQRKKLAKKAKDGVSDYPLELPTEKDIKERTKFHTDLMATEALVLLTSVDEYDLTAALKGKTGQLLGAHFGKESRSKLLCIRFGLLGFHWPFVRSTFYCSNSKHPVARSAAVMYAISRWNKKRPKAERCTILLDPTYKNAVPEQAIQFGGWYRVKLPASHIIDLRRHKSKSIHEFFKAIKYRNQDGAFRQAGGVTVEERSFTRENCDLAISLWQNIAKNRTDNGNTSVLIAPTSAFVQTLGSEVNESSHRTLLFLKVHGEVVASCILFRLGDTITSDLQGLHQEHARPLKAYFVMMQEVITIALREGKSFVDFGPTTEKPKVDIGCQSVPLTGALRASNMLLSAAVRVAAGNVKV